MAQTITYLSLLHGIKTKLESLRLNQVPGFEAAGDAAAFGAVNIYAHESISAAIADALVFDDRLAFIVPTERRFENAKEGNTLKARQTLGFVLLLADRVYGDRAAAAIGNAETPGVIALSELVLAALVGRDVGLAGVCLTPGDGAPFTLTSEEREDLTGREVFAQEFTTEAGTFLVSRARPGNTQH